VALDRDGESGRGARGLAAQRGNAVVFRAMPPRARGRIDAWGEPPPAFALMRALKTNFDPKGLCNPGRFVGGI
jgi:glycolate oxidase FAD binding subunit